MIVLMLLASCSTQKKTAASKPDASRSINKPPPSGLSGKARELDAINAARLVAYQEKYQGVLGSQTAVNNLALFDFIDEWMYTPYQYGGNSKSGIDCSRLSILLLQEVYHKSVTGSSADISRQTEPVAKNKLKEGDLVFFDINSDEVSHMGVYLANDKFIHSTAKAGVIISDLNDAYYSKYFTGGGRVKQ